MAESVQARPGQLLSDSLAVPLGPAAIDRAAALLEQARRDVHDHPRAAGRRRPRDLADAYAISDRLDERLGWDVAGWYLGATNVAIQELLGLDGPYVARVYRRLLHRSPATLSADDFPPMVVECEFSFALRSDLEPRATAYSRDEAAAAVDSVRRRRSRSSPATSPTGCVRTCGR